MSYEISIDRVVEMFGTLAGETDVSEGWLFCRSAVSTLTEWLDGSKALADNDFSICYAAAATAFYRYSLKSVKDDTDIKAGDITIKETPSSKLSFAETLMCDSLNAIEPLLKPRRFAFMKV